MEEQDIYIYFILNNQLMETRGRTGHIYLSYETINLWKLEEEQDIYLSYETINLWKLEEEQDIYLSYETINLWKLEEEQDTYIFHMKQSTYRN